jgi:ribosomal protein S18 acetylase RimI-like enzyme
MPHTPQSPDALITESHRQIHEAWRYFATHLPGGLVSTSRGVLVADGRSPLPFMNAAFLTDPVSDDEDLRERVAGAAAHFRAGGVPWVFMPVEDLLPPGVSANLNAIAADAGLQYMMPMTGMVADVLDPPLRPLPPLQYRAITDEATRTAAGNINGAGYAMPGDLVCTATTIPEIWTRMVGIVGYVDDAAVSTASVTVVDEVAYVCLVATDPAHQGKGYAEAVMRKALADAHDRWGTGRTVLHATPAGRPVYTRMGYASTNTFHVFVGGDGHA